MEKTEKHILEIGQMLFVLSSLEKTTETKNVQKGKFRAEHDKIMDVEIDLGNSIKKTETLYTLKIQQKNQTIELQITSEEFTAIKEFLSRSSAPTYQIGY